TGPRRSSALPCARKTFERMRLAASGGQAKRIDGKRHYSNDGERLTMDHQQAIESRVCERYLLGELAPEAREAYEEHYFSCSACAAELRAAAELLGASRMVLSESPAKTAVRQGWLGWLKPAVVVPALASLLAVVAYQNLVSIPGWKKAAEP